MPEQVRQLVEILNIDGDLAVITFEVIDNGGHLIARDNQQRAIFQFRPATLILGADGHAGGLLVRDQEGQSVFNFDAFNAGLHLGVLEHPANVVLVGNLHISDLSDREVLLFDNTLATLTIGAMNTNGRLVVKDSLGQDALRFSSSGAELRIGNSQNAGELLIRDAENRAVLFFDSSRAQLKIGDLGNHGELVLLDTQEREVMRVQGETGTLSLGAEDNGGTLRIRDIGNRDAFVFDTGQGEVFGPGASARIGTRDASGKLEIRDAQDRGTFVFRAENARLVLGTRDVPGIVEVRDRRDEAAVRLAGESARCTIGNSGNSGQLTVLHADDETAMVVNSKTKDLGKVEPNAPPTATIAGTATVRIGGRRVEGELEIEDGEGRTALRFESAGAATLRVGSEDREGRLILKDSENRETFSFESDKALLHIGSGGQERILVDGKAGDILFKNADIAERFPVANLPASVSGSVMIVDEDGRLRPCDSAYNRRVVGVVASAGHRRPGIILDAGETSDAHVPIAVVGKVCCRADATVAPISAGDLLTTSERPGHAMKAVDPGKAFGAVIGKALNSLEEGTGTIDLLIALQ